MKKILSLILLLLPFSGSALYAQYGVQVSLLAPTGYYSYVLKPAPNFEFFMKIGDIDEFYSVGASFGYSSFSPTQDTFRTYAVGGQYNNLFPGYEVLHSYDELFIGITNDFRILPGKKFCPFIGLDMHFDVISISEDDYAETLIQSSDQGDNYWVLSVLPRVGLQYELNDKFYLSGSFGRTVGVIGSTTPQDFWKTSITITYYVE